MYHSDVTNATECNALSILSTPDLIWCKEVPFNITYEMTLYMYICIYVYTRVPQLC
jgi:hypothetical protein